MSAFINYKEIENQYKTSWDIPYDVLLRTQEWRNFRETIINRDNKKCRICDKEQSEKVTQTYFRKPTDEEIAENMKEVLVDVLGDGSWMLKMKQVLVVGVPTESPTILHVHHKYYIFGYLPWEYTDEALMTVCHDCHIAIHSKEIISVFVESDFKDMLDLTPCTRCNGTGFLEQYLHFQNGICFRCNGRKFEQLIH